MTDVLKSIAQLRSLFQSSFQEKKAQIDSVAQQMLEHNEDLTGKVDNLFFTKQNLDKEIEAALQKLERALDENNQGENPQIKFSDIDRVEAALGREYPIFLNRKRDEVRV